jgi:hypothetical protein
LSFLKVYLVASAGMPRNHHSLLVETDNPTPGAGHIYQVTGNVQNGMTFEDKPRPFPPETEDPTFISKCLIGKVSSDDYADRFRQVCLDIAPPKRLYPSEPLIRCQEWTAMAIAALKEAGVVIRL